LWEETIGAAGLIADTPKRETKRGVLPPCRGRIPSKWVSHESHPLPIPLRNIPSRSHLSVVWSGIQSHNRFWY